jgi:hypothetical protein
MAKRSPQKKKGDIKQVLATMVNSILSFEQSIKRKPTPLN